MKDLIELDDLAYGNTNQENLPFLSMNNHFTKLKDHFIDFPYPQIDETELEIENLIRLQDNAKKGKNWKAQYKFMKSADQNLDSLFVNFYLKNELVFDQEFIGQIKSDLTGMVVQLKMHYQRARPYQVAHYTKQDLIPFNSASANTPAYPSGHATQIYFIGLVESFRFPHKEKEIKKFCHLVAKSREVMGVHYESDTEFGKTIALALSKHPTIIKRYFTKK
jgi:hypothetical protein